MKGKETDTLLRHESQNNDVFFVTFNIFKDQNTSIIKLYKIINTNAYFED